MFKCQCLHLCSLDIAHLQHGMLRSSSLSIYSLDLCLMSYSFGGSSSDVHGGRFLERGLDETSHELRYRVRRQTSVFLGVMLMSASTPQGYICERAVQTPSDTLGQVPLPTEVPYTRGINWIGLHKVVNAVQTERLSTPLATGQWCGNSPDALLANSTILLRGSSSTAPRGVTKHHMTTLSHYVTLLQSSLVLFAGDF